MPEHRCKSAGSPLLGTDRKVSLLHELLSPRAEGEAPIRRGSVSQLVRRSSRKASMAASALPKQLQVGRSRSEGGNGGRVHDGHDAAAATAAPASARCRATSSDQKVWQRCRLQLCSTGRHTDWSALFRQMLSWLCHLQLVP